MQTHVPRPALPHSSFASSARRELTGSTWADPTPRARWALSLTNWVTSCSSLSLLRMSTCNYTQNLPVKSQLGTVLQSTPLIAELPTC